MKQYDYIIIGSGFFGSICAYELRRRNKKILVLESRNHIGGNCYTENRNNINLHIYGPHIFHTSNEKVWKWINQFVQFNNFILTPVANYKNEIYSLPFNMWTFSKLFNVTLPSQAQEVIRQQTLDIKEATNLEEQAIKLVGYEIYEKLIKGYTKKQWKKDPKELPKEIIKRLPIRFSYNNNYFNDKYQGIPIGGYTQIFNKLLDKIEIKLNTDYISNRTHWDSIANTIIYTGPIDRFYNYCYGPLEYKTTQFDHRLLDVDNYQGCAVMNYTDEAIAYTRTIEHKYFENSKTDKTWVTWEYPEDYLIEKTEPYYPVNDTINNQKYMRYKQLSNSNILFGGRLAEYKYYDMHQVIESALSFVESIPQ